MDRKTSSSSFAALLIAGLLAGSIFISAANAGNLPIAATGWNSDVVVGSDTEPAVDVAPSGTFSWFSSGAVDHNGNAHLDGLPMGTNFTSAATAGGGTVFHLQPVTASNNLKLGYGYPSTGSLQISGNYSSISILAASYDADTGPANRGIGTYTIHYSNATTQTGNYSAFDWNTDLYGNSTNHAITGLGRNNGLGGTVGFNGGIGGGNTLESGFIYEKPVNFGLYETDLLTDPTLGITSIDFNIANSASGTSVFALSGTAVPEPTSMGLLGAAAFAFLGRRRRA